MKFSDFRIYAVLACFIVVSVSVRGAEVSANPALSQAAPKSVTPDVIQAKDIIQEAAKKYPHNAELQLQLGFIFKKLGKFKDSQKAFEESVKIDPHLVEGHYMLGLIYEYNKESKEALAAWQACLKWATDPGTKNTALVHIHHIAPSFVVKPKTP
jgi:Tfp pilus assembly protein PilF